MNLQNFFVAGINYKKTDASLRGQYAVSLEQYANILENAAQQDLKEVFIISTCNRTMLTMGWATAHGGTRPNSQINSASTVKSAHIPPARSQHPRSVRGEMSDRSR